MLHDRYVAVLRNHLHEIEASRRGIEAEVAAASPARRVELAGRLAVLSCRHRRALEKLTREERAVSHLWDGLRTEIDQDFAAFEDFIDRMIVEH